MRQRHLEDSQNVLKEDVDLLGAPDRPQVPGDVLVLPERQTFSAIWENHFRSENRTFLLRKKNKILAVTKALEISLYNRNLRIMD
jgi:hypothetical protein